MSSIKNLKSGSVPCKESGNSVFPAGADSINLDFGQVNVQDIIREQANKTMVVTDASRASNPGSTSNGGHGGTKK